MHRLPQRGVLDLFPEIRDAMVKRDYDYMSHGIFNNRYLNHFSIDEERAFFKDCVDSLYRHTGKQLKGMLTPGVSPTANTPDLMAEAGLIYNADWGHDDQPFPMNVKSGRLVSMPYNLDLNDGTFNRFGCPPDYWAQCLKDQFDVMYEEGEHNGTQMCVSLHPALTGHPSRIDHLNDALSYMLSHEGVWQATADEIAQHYMDNYYDDNGRPPEGAGISVGARLTRRNCMFQTPQTVHETLEQIRRQDLVLPAIQREFVWRPDQICRLFDSLMQGYPFGTFLFWSIDRENSSNYKYYGFVQDYHQRNHPHCPPIGEISNQQLTAVLDGQQRLTALNIGLRGSMAWKLPRKRFNNLNAYPKRRLYLDLLWKPIEDDETGAKFLFRFLATNGNPNKDGHYWFPVSEIMKLVEPYQVSEWLVPVMSCQALSQAQKTRANRILHNLHSVVYNKPLVAFYRENSQELEKVLQIFIRMNSGGTVLSYSDLLLSVAVAQWEHHDAREEIHTLVDDLNRIGNGFEFSKDLVLKAGLMLSDIGSVGFKVENFNHENMGIFEYEWDKIKEALTLTVQLVSDFGFSGQNLRAHNSILPVAYFIHSRDLEAPYLTQTSLKEDRRTIRDWLVKSLLKPGIWGSGLDTLLTALRDAIRESDGPSFPANQLNRVMNVRGKSIDFDDEESDALVDLSYGNRLTFALLSILFPFVDLRNKFHVDHIFPSSRFTVKRLKCAGVPDEKIDHYIQLKDGLPNLQLLDGPANVEKSAKLPHEWLSQTYGDLTSRKEYASRHLLGDVPKSIKEFDTFYDARRECLKERIVKLLGK